MMNLDKYIIIIIIIISDLGIALVKEEAELIEYFTHFRLRREKNHIGI